MELITHLSPEIFNNIGFQVFLSLVIIIPAMIAVGKNIVTFHEEMISLRIKKIDSHLDKFEENSVDYKILQEYRSQEIFLQIFGVSLTSQQREEITDWIFNKRINLNLIRYGWEYIVEENGRFSVKIKWWWQFYKYYNVFIGISSFSLSVYIVIHAIYFSEKTNYIEIILLLAMLSLICYLSITQLKPVFAAEIIKKKLSNP